MTGPEHDRSSLGPYVLGVLDDDGARATDEHLASCEACRTELAELAQMRELLGEVPPEAFLDGPPDGGDLLLQRTLRRVRAEASRPQRRRVGLVAAGVVALAAVTLGAGIVIGQRTAPTVVVQPPPPATVAGTRTVSASNPITGARMTATITPAAGWVRVNAKVEGVKAGEKCQLVVISRTGELVVAGSWLVSPTGERDGTAMEGSALVAPSDVASVDIVTLDGQRLVSATV